MAHAAVDLLDSISETIVIGIDFDIENDAAFANEAGGDIGIRF